MGYVADRNFLAEPAKTFATNRLVLVVPKSNPARISEGPDASKPGVRLIVGAETVPVGAYTRLVCRSLRRAGVRRGFRAASRAQRRVPGREREVDRERSFGEADAASSTART
jgi:molybdate transport system substrate-binding protein